MRRNGKATALRKFIAPAILAESSPFHAANAAASEAEALTLIAHERQARAADITMMAAGFRPPRRRSATAAPHLAALMKYEASDFTDVPPEKVPDAIIRMERLHKQLGVALTQLRKAALMPLGMAESQDLGGAA